MSQATIYTHRDQNKVLLDANRRLEERRSEMMQREVWAKGSMNYPDLMNKNQERRVIGGASKRKQLEFTDVDHVEDNDNEAFLDAGVSVDKGQKRPNGFHLNRNLDRLMTLFYDVDIEGIQRLIDGVPQNDDITAFFRAYPEHMGKQFNSDMMGGGIVDDIIRLSKKVKKKKPKKRLEVEEGIELEGGVDLGALVSELPDHAPPDMRNLLADWGDAEIFKMRVCRVPIAQALEVVANAITRGKVSAMKRDANIDRFFHLYMEMAIRNPDGTRNVVLVEKNQKVDVIQGRPGGVQKGSECMNVPLNGSKITLAELFTQAEDVTGAKKYWIYDAVNANCQFFVKWTLQANGLWKDNMESFVIQDVQSAVPRYLGTIMKRVTNLANRVQSFFKGRGY